MRKNLILPCALLTFFLLSVLASVADAASASNHMQMLKSEFPYGLLGDDYGILKVSDLANNACYFKPAPFPPEPFISPYEYWRCFESKNISLRCSSSGVSDEFEGPMGFVVVKVSDKQINYEYMERRPWPIKECRSFLKDLRALLKGTSHACVSGSFIQDEIDSTGHKNSFWLFDRLKTNRGCVGRNCDFTKKIMQENCPNITPPT